MQNFDIVIIGGGPGGYVAAIRAAQLGLKTAVVEKEHLGGVCLNWGCIPTKALLKSAEVKAIIDHAEDFGITVSDAQVHLDKIVERSRTISGQLAGGIRHLLKKNKVTVFEGHGTLKGQQIVNITYTDGKTDTLKAPHIVLATGARARTIPSLPVDEKIVWTARQAMTPPALPKSLLIVGSGAIGIEFASFYNAMGTTVTVVEMVDRILPQEDLEISQLAQKAFEAKGITFALNSTVKQIDLQKDAAIVTIAGPKGETKQTVDRVIVAIGVVGNTENLGLENTKVVVDKGQIQTNEWAQTAEPGVYAIGDVAGAPWLAHKASHEGVMCVEKIAGLKTAHPLGAIPGCTYSAPQIASVGLTEVRAKDAGYSLKVGRFPFKANGKALALGATDGLIKTIFDARTGALLGAHMVGADVTELIQGFVIAMSLETTEEELMRTIFPHPTLSEMMHESVLNAYGQTIHF